MASPVIHATREDMQQTFECGFKPSTVAMHPSIASQFCGLRRCDEMRIAVHILYHPLPVNLISLSRLIVA